MSRLSHLDDQGRARMVDVSDKASTVREATAAGLLRTTPEVRDLAMTGKAAKGDVLTTAELAGVMAAKRTSDLIPLCHPVGLDVCQVTVTPDPDVPGVRVRCVAVVTARTGIEMESLVAVSVACLTVYDMVKAADRSVEIGGIRLVEKTGGSSGDWQRDHEDR